MTRAYCCLCGTSPRTMTAHIVTKQHRTATRQKAVRPWNARTGRPAWALALARDPLAGTAEDNDAAMARLELM